MHYYDALLILRRLFPGKQPFHAGDLVHAARIPSTDRSTAAQIASGILSTLKRWGLIRYAGQTQGDGPRPLRLYVLTEWGKKFRPSKKAK